MFYGIKSKEAQKSLISLGNAELIELQSFLHPTLWCKEIKNEIRPNQSDEAEVHMAFLGWLHACTMGSRETEAVYGSRIENWLRYGVKQTPKATEEEQISWFTNHDFDKITNYEGSFKGNAFCLFLLNAPIKSVVKHLMYRILSEEEQLTLIRREMINGENMLLWYYFTKYKAYPKAQILIKKYDANLWSYVIMQNYGWEHKYEKKWGCLANWQNVLAKNIKHLSQLTYDEIPKALDMIE